MTTPSRIDRIVVAKVVKRYGRVRALSGVNIELVGGQTCAVVGDNGAGKSTLLGVVSSLVRPSSGTVSYFFGDSEVDDGAVLRSQIGVVAHQSLVYPQLSAVENLRFFARLYGVAGDRVGEVLDEVGLERRAWERPAGTYSRGMLQRLSLARTLLHEPSVVLLDEPFAGLDQLGIDRLRDAIARFAADGRVAVVVTHDLAAIEGLIPHVVLLRSGRVAVDDARSTVFSRDELANLYRAEAERRAS